jgi:hypothetical protein
MGKRLAIPRILGIDWWWILIVGLFEAYARYFFHVRGWIPSIWEIWMFGQMIWLKRAEPNDSAIYFFALWWALQETTTAIPAFQHMPQWSNALLGLVVTGLQFVSIFVFRAGMEKHISETEPRGLQLSGVMTFFFNELYFQYWFHQIYLEQNAPDGALTGVPEA